MGPTRISNFNLTVLRFITIFLMQNAIIHSPTGVECARRWKRQATEKFEDPKGFPFHPLDPLSPREIQLTSQIIKNHSPNGSWIFPCISLKEPEKSSLLQFFLSNTDPPQLSIPRKSFSLIIDLKSGKGFEVVVDIRHGKVENWNEIPKGLQPMMAYDENDFVVDALLTDERVVSRLNASGMTNLSMMIPDLWIFGYDRDRPEYQGRRLAQVFMYGRNFKNDNFWAHPTGFLAVVDLIQQKVIDVEILPIHNDFDSSNKQGDLMPMVLHNYDPELMPDGYFRRDEANPISFTQPDGPSFKIEKERNLIEWQNFKMRLGFNVREGLILYNINYNDKGKVRPLIYRASLSELFVPYGDPRPPFHRKMAFDLGQYGIGANELQSPADCKGSVKFLDTVGNNKDGSPTIFKNAICIYEEDVGTLWKKTDPESGRSVTVRSQRLVITFTATSGNYDYTFRWCFYQDASIKMEIDLNGVVNPNLMAKGADPRGYGTILSEQIDGHYHQHFFAVRLDTEIDGNLNSVSVVDIVPEEAPTGSPLNPYGNGFTTVKTPLTTASHARSKISPLTSRTWIISGDPNNVNAVTKNPMGYKLIAENTPPLMMKKDSPLHAKCAFVDYDVWVTPYREDQFYAGGYYLNNSGLPEWVEKNPDANVQNEDIVLWHVFGLTHIPRVEDFPVMSSETVGFWFKPSNFFVENPALDVRGFTFEPVDDST